MFFSVDNLTLSGPLFLQFCNSAQKANFTPKGPPFSFYFFKETYTTGRAQRVPPLDFFRHCATFFRKFLKFIKGYPLAFFLKFSVCRKRWMSLNGLFLSFSAFCDLKILFFSKKNFKNNFFEKFFFPNFYNTCSLNIFEPKIWRRLGTFPSCLYQLNQLNMQLKLKISSVYIFLVGAFLEKCARLLHRLVFFFVTAHSLCTYHFLVQTLIGLGGFSGRGFESLLQPETFSCFAKRTRLKSPPFNFFGTVILFFETFYVFKDEVKTVSPYGPGNIQSKALYPNFWRYIRTILRFTKEEAEVRKRIFYENILRIFLIFLL